MFRAGRPFLCFGRAEAGIAQVFPVGKLAQENIGQLQVDVILKVHLVGDAVCPERCPLALFLYGESHLGICDSLAYVIDFDGQLGQCEKSSDGLEGGDGRLTHDGQQLRGDSRSIGIDTSCKDLLDGVASRWFALRIQFIDSVVSVVIVPTPVDVEEVFLIITVDDEGMAAATGRIASEEDGPGYLQLVIECLEPFLIGIEFLHTSRNILKAETLIESNEA